jgi:hypothetical protein
LSFTVVAFIVDNNLKVIDVKYIFIFFGVYIWSWHVLKERIKRTMKCPLCKRKMLYERHFSEKIDKYTCTESRIYFEFTDYSNENTIVP